MIPRISYFESNYESLHGLFDFTLILGKLRNRNGIAIQDCKARFEIFRNIYTSPPYNNVKCKNVDFEKEVI